MKLRGPYKVSRSKTIPFLLTSVFLLLLGLALVTVGLLIEFHWEYEMEVFYKPWWAGGLVVVAGIFVSMFGCLRTPAVAVVVTTVCLPALAATILQLILSGLMADALYPDSNKFFCSSKLVDTTTLYCKCDEDISFNITVKGEVSSAATSAFCEDEIDFIFEIMLAVACVCGLLILLMFPYIMWVYCTVTRPTYAEKRASMMFSGTMTRSGSLLHAQRGTISQSPLVLANTMNNRSSRPPSRAQSVNSAGFRPIVTVQRAQSMALYQSPVITHGGTMMSNGTGTMRSKSGTLKSIKAPQPPKTETSREETVREPIYNNIERDPIRTAEQHRFEIPSDIHGIKPTNNRQSLSTTPLSIAKLHKSTRSLEEDDDSSDDNTTDVVYNFKSSPKQLNGTSPGNMHILNSNMHISDYAKT